MYRKAKYILILRDMYDKIDWSNRVAGCVVLYSIKNGGDAYEV